MPPSCLSRVLYTLNPYHATTVNAWTSFPAVTSDAPTKFQLLPETLTMSYSMNSVPPRRSIVDSDAMIHVLDTP
ncbi:hypothetical protein BDY19DRAFT_937257 [Irpex rosettiformis]|uniref:Uncharacterized protein n=1 Tax=Irpex rosettiformis TaxID=378272 RepID=A0ACB8U8X5_9APHY|nr:hypothetical protein BDY19DRAFT_937257 [Irpex rosettiformis]